MKELKDSEFTPNILFANYYLGFQNPEVNALESRFIYDYELELITEVDNGFMIENNVKTDIEPGDIIFRLPHQKTQGHNRYNSYILAFDAQGKKHTGLVPYQLEDIKPFQELISHPLLDVLPRKFNTHNYQGYLTVFKDIYTAYANPHVGAGLYARSLLTQMLYRLFREYTYIKQFEHKKAAFIRGVMSYIEKNLDSDLSLATLSKHYDYSPVYFHQLFKTITGFTLTVYITEKRIEKAKELLIHSSSSIKAICYDVGYKDPSYFTSVFSKHTGLTPKHYRDTYRINLYQEMV